MSFTLDFRKQVFKIKQKEKLTFQESSERFGIPIRTVFRWHQRIETKITRNEPPTKVTMEQLRKDVDQHPDSYQYERTKKIGVSQSTIFYALQRLKISLKKNAVPSQGR